MNPDVGEMFYTLCQIRLLITYHYWSQQNSTHNLDQENNTGIFFKENLKQW